MKLRTAVLGAILAGGKSTRMGADKSLLFVHGTPIIAHVARVMASVFRDVVVVSDDSEKYGFLKLDVIPDSYKGAGPIAGIHAALVHATSNAVFISSCDTPLLSRHLIEYILDYNALPTTVIPLHDGFLQPLCGIYETKLVPVFKKNLDSGKFKLTDTLKEIEYSTVEITPALSWYSPFLFHNVNRPEDFHQLHHLIPYSNVNPPI